MKPIWKTLLVRWSSDPARPLWLRLRLTRLGIDRHARGVESYGAPLTAQTPIDPGLELAEEVADACAYAQGWVERAEDAQGARERLRIAKSLEGLLDAIERERARIEREDA